MLPLRKAQALVRFALAKAHDAAMKPLAIAVFDNRGALRVAIAEDGTSLNRMDIAIGKARGALAMGVGSRALEKMAIERGHFIAGATQAIGGQLVPVAGGVLIRDNKGFVIGVVGVSGDTSDNDELVAKVGIEAVGYAADGGQA